MVLSINKIKLHCVNADFLLIYEILDLYELSLDLNQ